MQHPLKLIVIVQDHRNRLRVRSTDEVNKRQIGERAQELAVKAAANFRAVKEVEADE